MIDICTGGNSFIGKHLMQRIIDGALVVPHDAIHDTHFPDCDRFFFLSTYGNMAHHDDVNEIIRANIGHLGYVIGAYIEESRCNHFTFVSSSSVNLPVQTTYSHAKRAGEEMVLASCLPAVVVRPYSITGVGEQPEHLIPTLIRSCLEGEVMQFVAEPRHDFVDVEDLIDGILMLAEKKATGVFEFGKCFAYSNEDVKALVEEACGKKANIRPVESLRNYDSSKWICRDMEAHELGWRPKKTLEMSIHEMVTAYKFKRKQK